MADIDELKFMNVLYIEDDIQTLRLYSTFLSYYVASVHSCENTKKALDIYKNTAIDVIVTDLEMPEQSGVDFVRNLRKIDSKIKVIMLTAHTDPQYTIPSVELNVTRYLVKPVSKSALLQALVKSAEQSKQGIKQVSIDDRLIYDLESDILFSDGDYVKLSKKATALLALLVYNKDGFVSYDCMAQTVWPDDVVSENAIRCQIRALRNKVPQLDIENIPSIGYKLHINNRK